MKPFKKLRGAMYDNEVSVAELAKAIGISKENVSVKLNAHMPFRLNEAYTIMDTLGLDYKDFTEYFPKEESTKGLR